MKKILLQFVFFLLNFCIMETISTNFQSMLLLFFCCHPEEVTASIEDLLKIFGELQETKEMLTNSSTPEVKEKKQWEEVHFVQSIMIAKTRLGMQSYILYIHILFQGASYKVCYNVHIISLAKFILIGLV